MEIWWQEVVKYLGSIIVITGAVAWLARTIVVHILAKDTELYKHHLADATQKEIEHLKATLNMTVKEHEFRFKPLHDKRALAIEQLNSQLGMLLPYISQLHFVFIVAKRSSFKENEEWMKLADQFFSGWWSKFRGTLDRNTLYLTESLRTKLESLRSQIEKITSAIFECNMYHNRDIDEESAARKKLEDSLRDWSNHEEETETVINQIQAEFRTLLGVTN